MKIQEKDIFHGAALTQVVEHTSFKALNSASKKYGHYLVNADRNLLVKHRKPNTTPWVHTFSKDEVTLLATLLRKNEPVYVCLVCGTTTVCALDGKEIATLLDMSSNNQQWIRIDVPKGGSCHVTGSNGSLKRTVPHNSFPDKVFE